MKKIWWGIKLAVLSVCFFFAVRYSIAARKNTEAATVFLEEQQPDLKRAEEICAQELEQESPQDICFWGEQKDAAVSCHETGKTDRVSMTVVKGNPNLAIPETGTLIWQENGCFIDTGTAVSLFGTAQVSGQNVWCGEKAYTVCGTFESMRKVMVRQAERGELFQAVSIRLSERKNVKDETEQFLMRYGLSGDTVDFVFLSALANDLLLVVPVILSIKLLYALLHGIRQRAFAWLVPAALILAALLWAIRTRVEIPADMIPSKWSDFSFWASWWKEQRQNMLHIIGSAQGEAQFDVIWNLVKSLLFNTAAVCLSLGNGFY